jgi:hypothetical protein
MRPNGLLAHRETRPAQAAAGVPLRVLMDEPDQQIKPLVRESVILDQSDFARLD